MKLIIILISFYLFCIQGCKQKNLKLEKDKPINSNEYIDIMHKEFLLKKLYAKTGDVPARDVMIEITFLFKPDKYLYQELTGLENDIRKIIKKIISGKYFRDLNSVEGYDKLHNDIKNNINILLKKGKIDKVLFNRFDLSN